MNEKVFRGYRMRWVQFFDTESIRGKCKYPNCESLRRERGEFSSDCTNTFWKDREYVQARCDSRNEFWAGSFYHDVEEVWRTPIDKE